MTCQVSRRRVPATPTGAGRVLVVLAVLGLLGACGVKPDLPDPPQGEENDTFPQQFPSS